MKYRFAYLDTSCFEEEQTILVHHLMTLCVIPDIDGLVVGLTRWVSVRRCIGWSRLWAKISSRLRLTTSQLRLAQRLYQTSPQKIIHLKMQFYLMYTKNVLPLYINTLL